MQSELFKYWFLCSDVYDKHAKQLIATVAKWTLSQQMQFWGITKQDENSLLVGYNTVPKISVNTISHWKDLHCLTVEMTGM